MRTWLLLVALTILVGSACGGDDTDLLRTQVAQLQTQIAKPTATVVPTPTLGPDVVVGVSWTCNFYSRDGGPNKAIGDVCRIRYQSDYVQTQKNNPGFTVQDILADVAVRTTAGTVYHVSVSDPKSWIEIGDPWPK